MYDLPILLIVVIIAILLIVMIAILLIVVIIATQRTRTSTANPSTVHNGPQTEDLRVLSFWESFRGIIDYIISYI